MDGRSRLRIFLLLFALAYATYAGSLWNGFAGWDDRTYVIDNRAAHGLSWANVRRAFTQVLIGTYTPLQTISYAADYTLWGLNPYGYHATNLLLHSIDAALLYAVLLCLLQTKRAARFGGIAAAVFVLHPAHVESVAWIAERKDVLSTAFLFLALLRFLRRGRSRAIQWGTLVLFVCACLSKPTAIVFPLLLVVIEHTRGRDRVLRRLMPFFVAGGVLAIAGVAAQASSGAIHPLHGGSLLGNYGTMSWALVRYAGLLWVPVNLSALHWVVPCFSWADARLLAGGAFAAATGIVLVWSARRSALALLIAGWLLVPLLPVSNVIPLSVFMAERYLYLPLVGFGLLLAAVGQRGKRGWALATILVCYGALSVHRCWVWRGAEAMWSDAVRKSSPNPVAHYNLGVYFAERGLPSRALREYRNAVAQNPKYMKARSNLGNLLLQMGRTKEAIATLKSVAEDFPQMASVHYNLGVAYYRGNDVHRAISCYERAVGINAQHWPAHLALAAAYARDGKKRAKVMEHLRALDGAELPPEDAAAAQSLARTVGMTPPPNIRVKTPTADPARRGE